MKKKIAIGLIVLAVIVGGALGVKLRTKKPAANSNQTTTNSQQAANKQPSFNKQQYSTTDPTSIWVVVNKPHGLQPIDYAPTDLVMPNVLLRVPGNESMQVRKVTASALETMFAAADKDGIKLMLSSGYRSYNYQVNLYGGYVSSSGQASADTFSARPGHSEHQTGLAADIEPSDTQCELEQCFATTPGGKWLAENAYKYGFIIRYTTEKVGVTGYESEPWHIRYIGTDLASEMQRTGVKTLEEFFGISGGANY